MTNTQRKPKLIKLGRMIRITEFGLKEKFYFAKILGFALVFACRCWVSLWLLFCFTHYCRSIAQNTAWDVVGAY